MFQNSSIWSDLQAFVNKSFSRNFLSVGGHPGAFLMDDHAFMHMDDPPTRDDLLKLG